MTDAALGDLPGVPLELGGGDIVVGVDPGGPFGVGAAVAGFAGHAAVRPAEAVKLAGSLGKPLVGRRSKGVAAGSLGS